MANSMVKGEGAQKQRTHTPQRENATQKDTLGRAGCRVARGFGTRLDSSVMFFGATAGCSGSTGATTGVGSDDTFQMGLPSCAIERVLLL